MSISTTTELMKSLVLIFTLRAVSPERDSPSVQQSSPRMLRGGSEMKDIHQDCLDMAQGCKDWSPRPLICLLRYICVR